MPQIIPIKDLRDTTRISEMCHNSDEPIFVTKNGYGDMVVMSMLSYENICGRVAVHDAIKAAADQIDNGIYTDGNAEFASLDRKYGI